MDIKSNYFELFQLPLRYDVDLALLANRYRSLQRQLHPDRFAAGSDQEKRLAIQYSTYINQAYQCLRSPVERAAYLLGLDGVSRESSRTIGNDPPFLMQQMVWREQLEELAQAGNVAALQTFMTGVKTEQRGIEQLLSRQLAEKQHEAALDTLGKLQFVTKLAADADARIEKLLDDE